MRTSSRAVPAVDDPAAQRGRPDVVTAALAAGVVLVTAAAHAAPPADPDFARDVAPLFATHCVRCHGPDEAQAGLRLDSRSRALVGGDGGAALVPGSAATSLLLARLTDADPDRRMPPPGEPGLSAAEVDLLRRWIDTGAAWPADPAAAADPHPHWAFRPPVRPPLPAVRDAGWVRRPLDRFVLSRLEAEGIAPAPEADRATLLRRLHLDLVGLPPSLGVIDRVARDARPDWYERVVDELLASPHFGERHGRHWLDLARYADTDGNSGEKDRPDAWRYRDWVIDAVNRDLPFDQFTIWQLAGDLLPDAGRAERTAAGFHRNALSSRETCVPDADKHVRSVYDRTIATGEIWLGLTVGCVQCHSHKYDPLTQREFFGLYAFFDNLEEVDLPVDPPEAGSAAIPSLAERREGRRETFIHVRGDFLQRGDTVRPHTFAVLPALEPRGAEPDRLDLARWLVDDRQPLTARVAVNRVWLGLFGRGLVPTVNDFGTRGEPPSHPDLLDWLAVEFRTGGWSRKALVRDIVLSATYRQSSAHRPDLAARDPHNRLLARQNRFRLEGEIIRDQALVVAGRMNPRVGGPSCRPPVPAEAGAGVLAEWRPQAARDDDRRGMYIVVQRTMPHPLLATLDVPDGNAPCLERTRANTPLQALATMNDPMFHGYARAAGARIDGLGTSVAAGIDTLVRLALARPPTADERAHLTTLFDTAVLELSGAPDVVSRLADGPGAASAAAAGSAGAAERAAWILLAQTVLNLDEFLTRE